MTIKEMHYDFKKKLNKVDSQNNRNLLVPEIDWSLREAESLYIKLIAEPRIPTVAFFENKQRTIDDIRTLVKEDVECRVEGDTILLPTDYLFHIKTDTHISKGECKNKKAKLYIRQHDEDFESSVFDRSSFEWRMVNGVFYDRGIRFYTDEFTVSKVLMTYIKKPRFMHNAEDFSADGYKLPSGQLLKGSVNCELPEHTHTEIVDLAVLLVSGELINNYQAFTAKFNLNLK